LFSLHAEAVRGVSFLWIRDLSYPDSIAILPFVLPLLGAGVNLLPILMTLISVAASLTQPAGSMTPNLITRQRRNLLLMATGFFLLFYPFPASMVLYWTTSNTLQLVEQTIRRD
jgi:membrane protein insertase Oxa1/YidC/SpoIIIJ